MCGAAGHGVGKNNFQHEKPVIKQLFCKSLLSKQFVDVAGVHNQDFQKLSSLK